MSTSTGRWRLPAIPPDWDDLSWVPFLRPGIAIEECRTPERYVLRAELPGVDPGRDVHLTCHRGLLRLRVHRDRSPDATHTEFHSGTACRTVALPAGARAELVTARYADGILEITVPVVPPAAPTVVPVARPEGE
jgi:HSP20 family protein